jgi:GNAT superfamily N-acetyltransferase
VAPEQVTIERLDPADVEVLRPLWLALRDHHGSVTADWGPVRDDETSWARRRASYVTWLAEPDAFALVARRGHRAVGYVLVTVNEGSPTWAAVARFGYVETLSVLPAERGSGIGRLLLHAAEDHLATLGVEHVELTVVAANAAARRFYAREGYDDAFITVQRRTRRTH